MINRIKHSINGVEFVPNNKDEFTLSTSFPDNFGEWENDFTADNKVVLPNEGYNELIRHLNETGVQQMPEYDIAINEDLKPFFVDLYKNVRIAGSFAEVSINNFDSKENIKSLVDDLTFEYLFREGYITESSMIDIPYVVIPQDMGNKILGITSLMFTIVKEAIDRIEKIDERVGNLVAGTVPSIGIGPVSPMGNIIAYGIFLAMDIATLILLNIAMHKLIKQSFELLLPPVRNFKAMTVDRLLTIALGRFNISYQSSLKPIFKQLAIIPVPVDYQKKKFFELLLNEDTRVLNRGYPTASDKIPTAGLLIEELSKMYNISPRIGNGILTLEPKASNLSLPQATLDNNFSNQDSKESEIEIDTSKLWNTKILSYKNDPTDKMLFDNPRGLRVEYKSKPIGAEDELTIIKGFQDTRINLALATIKDETKLEEFLEKLAKVADKLLNTAFMALINKRKGVMAISQDNWIVTKLMYQKGGKQTKDYLSIIGANALYKKYHLIDESKNNLYVNHTGVNVRMDNEQFLTIIQNNLVLLEGKEVEVMNVNFTPEKSIGSIDYRVKQLDWANKIKSIKVYEE